MGSIKKVVELLPHSLHTRSPCLVESAELEKTKDMKEFLHIPPVTEKEIGQWNSIIFLSPCLAPKKSRRTDAEQSKGVSN